jgi:hypothetical protein
VPLAGCRPSVSSAAFPWHDRLSRRHSHRFRARPGPTLVVGEVGVTGLEHGPAGDWDAWRARDLGEEQTELCYGVLEFALIATNAPKPFELDLVLGLNCQFVLPFAIFGRLDPGSVG